MGILLSLILMDLKISDIAREAGVSEATVSRVLNNSPVVKSKTVALVKKTIDRLGYVRPEVRPGPRPGVARGAKLRHGQIAFIVVGGTSGFLGEPTLAKLIEDLQAECRKHNLDLVLDQMSAVGKLPNCVQSQRVDGAIVMIYGQVAGSAEMVAQLAEALPVVRLFGVERLVAQVDQVAVNDLEVGTLAYRALKEAGCQSMAVVDGGDIFHESCVVRGRAFLDRVALGRLPAVAFVQNKTDMSAAASWPQPLEVFERYEGVATALAQSALPRPIGVFLTLDKYVRELHSALERKGLLNSDVRLIVAGTTPAYVEKLAPAPQLIDLRFGDLIAVMVDRLIAQSQSQATGCTLLISPQLVA